MIDSKNKGVGYYTIEQYRDGKLIKTLTFENLATYQGLNSLLGVGFHADAQITQWFEGLVDNTGFSGATVSDLMTSHVGWAEFVGYSEANRPQWIPGAPATGMISNPAATVHTINASGTIIGIFLSSSNVKGGTAGILWNVATIPTGALTVSIGDVLNITYSYTLT